MDVVGMLIHKTHCNWFIYQFVVFKTNRPSIKVAMSTHEHAIKSNIYHQNIM